MKKTSSIEARVLLLLIAVTLSSCKGTDPSKNAAPESRPAEIGRGWKRVDAGASFSFWLPEDMQQQRATGIDSLVGEYRSPNMRITFDYGLYSNPLTSYSNSSGCEEDTTTISGRDARIVECKKARSDSTYEYFAAIHFSEVHPAAEGGGSVKLTMEAEFNQEGDLETARKILESIAFK